VGERLNVMHIVLSLDVGGLERNVVNQVREGVKLGQRVAVVCLERPGVLAPQAEKLGARVISLDKPPGIRLGVVGRLRPAVRSFRPHVIHTHQIGSLFYAGLTALVSRVPLIVHTEHGRETYDQRLRTRWLGRLGGRFARRFYCLTKDMAEWVTSHRIVPPAKVRVIHNGIETDCFREPGNTAAVRAGLNIPADARVIGTVGRLNEIKQQDLLIRAFAKIKEPNPPIHLLIVGEGPLREVLERQAAELGVASRVHFAGYQPETAPYLHAMQVFALTSRSEGMPQALLEACVAGVPVVASRVGGIPEVIEHERNGLLFESGNEAALGNAIESLLMSPDLARRLAGNARVQVESTFNVGRMAAEYHRDFLEILGRASPAASG
jgi:sugar transferase (PEP-CTERM/EpsH1 system associated)